MKATDRVKVVGTGLDGAVGEVVSVNEEEGTAVVYISGIVNGLEVNGRETLPLDKLELA
jgi:hypothetical protein